MPAVLTSEADRQHGNHDDPSYDAFLARMSARFSAMAAEHGALFTTNAEGLWETYLGHFAPHDQQYHNCNACRHFIERFGGLVFIDQNGVATSAMWSGGEADADCAPSIIALQHAVGRAEVTGVFQSGDKTLGQPVTGIWRHLSATLPITMVHKHPLLTAGQSMAEKREDYRNMQRALGDFTGAQVDQALQLLNSDALYRSEKVIGPAQFLRDLIAIRDDNRNQALRRNLTWRRIAAAPAGFCHPRSSMIGSLLEDIAAGLDFADVSRKFAAKMHPLQYQRPQSAPSAGAIAAAEAAFAKLGAAGALTRRLARMDELQALWKPAPRTSDPTRAGVFGHLKAKGADPMPASMRVPAQTMTFDKFSRTVLPNAERIDVLVPSHSSNWVVFVTAADASAPPILQWDREDARNPVSWYVWNGGAPASQYGLLGDKYHEVSAVAFKPSMWGSGMSHQGQSATFVVRDARETRSAGAALFPEILRSEFHGMRSVIESFSRNADMQGLDQPHAAGLQISAGSNSPISVRVHGGPVPMEYLIDRWD
jgi:hypothetical protein